MTTLPTIGMEFDSVDEARQFWVEYGRKTGFGVRKQWVNKRKKDMSITSCRFVCCKEGHRRVDKRSFTVKNPRAETRTGCNARISLTEKNGKFVIHEFVGDHNHCLQLAETTHMLASHRKISEVQAYEIEMAEDCGLMQKANFQLMRVVEDKRYNELVCEFESRHKLAKLRYEHSPILMQLAYVYTPTIFDLFSEEWRVLFDPVNYSITCTCRKFETFGILCCHALKVFDANDVKLVPNQYILKRWTRDARNGVIYDLNRNEVIEDPKLSSTRRYRQLCPTMIRLAAEVLNSEKLHQFVEKGIHELCKQVIELRLQERSLVNDEGDDPIVTKEYVTQAKGFKKRQGLKTTRRLKSWNEVQPKRKRKPPAKKPSPCEGFEDDVSLSQIDCGTSILEHQMHEFSQPSENQFSYTRLLMEPLSD